MEYILLVEDNFWQETCSAVCPSKRCCERLLVEGLRRLDLFMHLVVVRAQSKTYTLTLPARSIVNGASPRGHKRDAEELLAHAPAKLPHLPS
jgi:hypothetical protein